jgi:signal transduction histidine kinase
MNDKRNSDFNIFRAAKMSQPQNSLEAAYNNALLLRLNEIASTVMNAAEAGDLEQVLERIAQVCGEMVNARYAALGIPDDDGRLKYFKVAGLTIEQIRHIDHLPSGHGLLGAIMQERKPLRLEKMTEDPRSSGFCAKHPTMTSLLGVPVQLGDRLFGLLYMCDRRDGQPFTEQDERLVQILAGYAAFAIAGSQLVEQQSRLTLLEERERVSMALHDGIIQSLYAVGVHLQLIQTSPDASPNELTAVMKELDTVVEDIRRYILNLKPNGNGQPSLAAAIREIVARLRPPTELEIDIQADDTIPTLAHTVFESIYQMMQEGISNAIRHARARQVLISVGMVDGRLRLMIQDDGQGFEVKEAGRQSRYSGLGLRNMQQRVLRLNGEINIDSAPGNGTTVTITLPITGG